VFMVAGRYTGELVLAGSGRREASPSIRQEEAEQHTVLRGSGSMLCMPCKVVSRCRGCGMRVRAHAARRSEGAAQARKSRKAREACNQQCFACRPELIVEA